MDSRGRERDVFARSLLSAVWAGLTVAGCGGDSAEPAVEPLPMEHVFSIAVIADPHIAGDEEHDRRLSAAIDWINHHASDRAIELTLVLGDIGWGEGASRARLILDDLSPIWIPAIGDNEIHGGSEETYDTVFSSQLSTLASQLEDWQRAPTPVWHPDVDGDAWLQNYAFNYRGLQVIVLDWCIRGQDGVMGEFGDLNDFEGGTWPWFEEIIGGVETDVQNSIILASHIPMSLGAFDHSEMDLINGLLEPLSDYVYGNLAGHLHGNLVLQETLYDAYITDATWDDEISVRVIDVSGNGTDFSYDHEIVFVP